MVALALAYVAYRYLVSSILQIHDVNLLHIFVCYTHLLRKMKNVNIPRYQKLFKS